MAFYCLSFIQQIKLLEFYVEKILCVLVVKQLLRHQVGV